MQYQEALDYLYSRLPVYHRIGPKALKPGLANIERLCNALGNPQGQFRSIHVAGTNGKGSTSHMLAAIYQSAGYRVGLYTSPHLRSFTERIRLGGQPIAETEVARFVSDHQTLIETVEPSFFEVTVALAFAYFARQQVDVAVIEVGLGGRLDSTNLITPMVSVITNIGYDHMDVLGETLPQIAAEKAGIIKPGVPIVVGETQPATEAVFRQTAAAQSASLVFADQQYTARDGGVAGGLRRVRVSGSDGSERHLALDLTGAYQLRNLLPVLATVALLQPRLPVTAADQQHGLAAVTRLTGLKGRFQRLQERPTVIADTAHNQPGLTALLATVETLPYARLRIVFGLVADKNRETVWASLPVTAAYYFCQAGTPRSLPAVVLREEAAAVGLSGAAYPDVNAALGAALGEAAPDDLVLVTGSNYIIAELANL